MQPVNYKIIDWDDSFEKQALDLEHSNIQGTAMRIEIIKKQFMGRALVFPDHYSCLAVTGDKLVGSASAGQTILHINDQPLSAGIGFDLKVHHDWRNQGIGKDLTRQLYKNFFLKKGLTKNIMTAKKVNTPVYKMVSRTIDNSTHYPFVYLVLPANSRIRLNNGRNCSQQFKVGLFEEEKICPSYFTKFNSGLGCFYTNKMYHLRVHKLDWKLNSALRILKMVYPKKYSTIPGRNENIFTATLYNQSIENINGINEVLRHIESKGLSQLMVCCQRNDEIYRSLKKYAISVYDYTLKADFKIDSADRLSIDVRCL